MIGPDLYRQCLQVGEQPSRGQSQELVPREVQFSQGGQDQVEVFKTVVAQIQHLDMIK